MQRGAVSTYFVVPAPGPAAGSQAAVKMVTFYGRARRGEESATNKTIYPSRAETASTAYTILSSILAVLRKPCYRNISSSDIQTFL